MRALQRTLSPSNTTSSKHGLIATVVGIIAPVTAFAASGVSDEGSGIFVWIFLGFFAVIVVGQLIPAVMLITGLVRGISARTKTETETETK